MALGAPRTARQGSGTVDFKVGANGDHATRKGSVAVNDTSLAIVQDAAPCTFGVARSLHERGSRVQAGCPRVRARRYSVKASRLDAIGRSAPVADDREASPVERQLPSRIVAELPVSSGECACQRTLLDRSAARGRSGASARPSRCGRCPRSRRLVRSATTLRGDGDAATLVIPPDTDIVALEIAIEDESIARGEIRAVGGGTVWVGPARFARSASASIGSRSPPSAVSPTTTSSF